MSDATLSRTEWLERIEQERVIWDGILADAEAKGLEQPGAMGEWTFKDLIAHLIGWRIRTVDRLESAARDVDPPPTPWPADMEDPGEEGDPDEVNRWIYEQNKDTPAAELIAQSRAQFDQMRDAVAAIPEDALNVPGRFAWIEPYPISAVIASSFEHLHIEHEPDIRAWLATPSSS